MTLSALKNYFFAFIPFFFSWGFFAYWFFGHNRIRVM